MSATLRADPRLAPYATLGVVGALAALLTGQAAFLGVAAPALVALARGTRPVAVPTVEVDPPPRRVIEGDEWTLRLRVGGLGGHDVAGTVRGIGGHRVLTPLVLGVTSAVNDRADHPENVGGGVVEGRVTVRAHRWGRHRLGRITLRVRRPGGLLYRDVVVEVPGDVRVLPAASRLDALVHPVRPHASAGAHAARARGPGTDFADLRPYVPGDRLRDVSWTASARTEQPWVVVHHPERSGTVVLQLDGFGEVGVPPAALGRAARIVWSLARHHLERGDRVGLLATGPAPVWLSPVAGRRRRWQVLDALLDARGHQAARTDGVDPRRRPTIPSGAFIVGVSPLQADAFVADVVHHRRRGRAVTVVGVEVADLLAPPADRTDEVARRLWLLEAEVRRATLASAGVSTTLVRDDATPAVRAMARLRDRHAPTMSASPTRRAPRPPHVSA